MRPREGLRLGGGREGGEIRLDGRPRRGRARSLKTEQHALRPRGSDPGVVGMARFTRTPSMPTVRREPHRSVETTSSDRTCSSEQWLSKQLGSPRAPRSRGLSMNFFMESLILAQDERWRRA
jgi:hypothetical protein